MATRTNERRLEGDIIKLRQSLPEGMHLTTKPYHFPVEGRPNYFALELTLKERLKADLESYVNTRLSSIRAVMRFIGYHDIEDGRVRYSAEIVPNSNVKHPEMAIVTEEFLHSLPPVLRNFWMSQYKHNNHDRKKGKRR